MRGGEEPKITEIYLDQEPENITSILGILRYFGKPKELTIEEMIVALKGINQEYLDTHNRVDFSANEIKRFDEVGAILLEMSGQSKKEKVKILKRLIEADKEKQRTEATIDAARQGLEDLKRREKLESTTHPEMPTETVLDSKPEIESGEKSPKPGKKSLLDALKRQVRENGEEETKKDWQERTKKLLEQLQGRKVYYFSKAGKQQYLQLVVEKDKKIKIGADNMGEQLLNFAVFNLDGSFVYNKDGKQKVIPQRIETIKYRNYEEVEPDEEVGNGDSLRGESLAMFRENGEFIECKVSRDSDKIDSHFYFKGKIDNKPVSTLLRSKIVEYVDDDGVVGYARKTKERPLLELTEPSGDKVDKKKPDSKDASETELVVPQVMDESVSQDKIDSTKSELIEVLRTKLITKEDIENADTVEELQIILKNLDGESMRLMMIRRREEKDQERFKKVTAMTTGVRSKIREIKESGEGDTKTDLEKKELKPAKVWLERDENTGWHLKSNNLSKAKSEEIAKTINQAIEFARDDTKDALNQGIEWMEIKNAFEDSFESTYKAWGLPEELKKEMHDFLLEKLEKVKDKHAKKTAPKKLKNEEDEDEIGVEITDEMLMQIFMGITEEEYNKMSDKEKGAFIKRQIKINEDRYAKRKQKATIEKQKIIVDTHQENEVLYGIESELERIEEYKKEQKDNPPKGVWGKISGFGKRSWNKYKKVALNIEYENEKARQEIKKVATKGFWSGAWKSSKEHASKNKNPLIWLGGDELRAAEKPVKKRRVKIPK